MANNIPNGNQVLNGDGNNGDDDPEMNHIQCLLGREITYTLNHQQAAVIISDIRLQEARRHALSYITSTTQLLQFFGQTISMSIIYLDRFLASRRRIEEGLWSVRVLAIACLSLSTQMDEYRRYVPQLSEYPVGDYGRINVADIRTMELTILNALNWDMNVVTPFPFANFILSRFNRQISQATSIEIDVLILTLLRDLRSMIQRPSVIAAAAILFALNKSLTRQQLEIEIHAMPLNGFLNIDNVWYCYGILWELNNRNI